MLGGGDTRCWTWGLGLPPGVSPLVPAKELTLPSQATDSPPFTQVGRRGGRKGGNGIKCLSAFARPPILGRLPGWGGEPGASAAEHGCGLFSQMPLQQRGRVTPPALNRLGSSGFSSQPRGAGPWTQEDGGDPWTAMRADTDVQPAARGLLLERPRGVMHPQSISPCWGPAPWPGLGFTQKPWRAPLNTTVCIFPPCSGLGLRGKPPGQPLLPTPAALPPAGTRAPPVPVQMPPAVLGAPGPPSKVRCAHRPELGAHICKSSPPPRICGRFEGKRPTRGSKTRASHICLGLDDIVSAVRSCFLWWRKRRPAVFYLQASAASGAVFSLAGRGWVRNVELDRNRG